MLLWVKKGWKKLPVVFKSTNIGFIVGLSSSILAWIVGWIAVIIAGDGFGFLLGYVVVFPVAILLSPLEWLIADISLLSIYVTPLVYGVIGSLIGLVLLLFKKIKS